MTEARDTHFETFQSEGPATQIVYNRLLTMLINGKFKVGQPIREAVLSKELGIGRGAIREALNLLVTLDVLEYTPYCGYRLLPCTLRDTLEWYDIRLGLEPRALELLLEQPWAKHEQIFSEMSKILDEEEKHIESNNFSGIWRSDISFHLKIAEGSNNRRMANLFLRCAMPFLATYEFTLEADLDTRVYNQINMSKDELCHTNTRHR